MQQEILHELRTPDRLRETLDVVDIVLGFLSSGGGRADQPLGGYVNHTLKMKRRPFSEKVGWLLLDGSCCPGQPYMKQRHPCYTHESGMYLTMLLHLSLRLESTAPSVMSCLSGRPSLWSLHDSSHSRDRYEKDTLNSAIIIC